MDPKNPPNNRYQLMAKNYADNIELEIHKIESIDHKVKHDIDLLK